MEYEYRVFGIHANPTSKPDPEKASKKLNVSKEFIQQEFAEHYKANKSVNLPLQIQTLLNMYGKRGWEHYYEGKMGPQILLYFRRLKNNPIPDVSFSPDEEAKMQKLAVDQRP